MEAHSSAAQTAQRIPRTNFRVVPWRVSPRKGTPQPKRVPAERPDLPGVSPKTISSKGQKGYPEMLGVPALATAGKALSEHGFTFPGILGTVYWVLPFYA